MARQFTLTKQQRLKSRKQIDAVFANGSRINFFPYRVFYLFERIDTAAQGKLQCGAGASTRNFKKAVDRNRVKRLTREAWRLQKNGLEKHLEGQSVRLSVFLIFTAKELPDFTMIKGKISLIVEKLIVLSDEYLAAHS